MPQITFIYTGANLDNPVTGGHLYEKELREALSEREDITLNVISTMPIRNKISRLLQPLTSLKLLSSKDLGDIVVFNSATCAYYLPLSLLLRLKGKKTAVIHHHFLHRQFTGLKKSIYRFLENSFMHSANAVIVPNPYVMDEMKKTYRESKLFLWQNTFEKKLFKDSLPIPGNLCYIGTIEPRKGLIYLIKSLVILKKMGLSTHLDIIGKTVDNSYYEKLREIIAKNGLDVEFHGFVEDSRLKEILSSADIFTFPSLLEGFGRVLIEANTFGLPIVCFNNSAMPYTVKDRFNGLLCQNKNIEDMADAIYRITQDRSLRRELSLGAYETASSSYSKEDLKKDIDNDLDRLCHRSS